MRDRNGHVVWGPPNAVVDAVIERRTYRGGFDYTKLTYDKLEQIQALAAIYHVNAEVAPTFLDLVPIVGRTNGAFPQFLSELAAIIQDAEGEVECSYAPDNGDIFFEFFSIREGKLCCQRGYIVRESIHLFDYDQDSPPRQPGSARGLIQMRDDFDEPLEEFAEYQ